MNLPTHNLIDQSPIVLKKESANIVPGRLIVTFKKGTNEEEIQMFAKNNCLLDYKELTDCYKTGEYTKREPIFLFELEGLDFEKTSVKRQELLKEDTVYCIDFDHNYELEWYPNDSDIGQQWAVNKINLPGAWDITTGNSQTKVGIIEYDGVHGYHSEIYNNIDGSLGYDYVNSCNYNHSYGSAIHGTMVAGIIGARCNNSYGIAGVCNNVTMVPYVSSLDSNFISALTLASQNGVKIMNCSMGAFNVYAQAVENAISSYNGLLICSAGNYHLGGQNTDSSFHYPSGYNCSNIISVGNSDSSDSRYFTSNYGQTSVDLFAPGTDIYSTIPTNSFGTDTGTSFAAPYVTGVCALLLSKYPCATMSSVKNAVLNNVDTISALSSYCVTGGRLNAYKALYYSDLHSYDYSQYNSVMHVAFCSCGVSSLKPHNLGPSYMSGGMLYRDCIQCGYTKLVGGINSYENPTE